MISLKKHLDKLAGPKHPFAQGPLVESLEIKRPALKNESKAALEFEVGMKLKKLLRINAN